MTIPFFHEADNMTAVLKNDRKNGREQVLTV
jgi:hypothetical protein